MKIRFERGEVILDRYDAAPATVEIEVPAQGEADQWVQLTYSELRLAPDGVTIAYLDGGEDWQLVIPSQYILAVLPQYEAIWARNGHIPFSDIVIGMW